MLDDITTDTLHTVTGGLLATTATANTGTGSRGSDLGMQTALTGLTSALDSLEQSRNKSSLDELLPVAIMARWIRQNG